MRHLFVDTAGWLCYVDRAQPGHGETVSAVLSAIESHRRLVTTNYVLAELVPLLGIRTRVSRPQMLAALAGLRSSPAVDIVHVDKRTDADAWSLLNTRPDKNWSLVDCASFVVMHDLGITEALTTDHHFEQAGFTCVPGG